MYFQYCTLTAQSTKQEAPITIERWIPGDFPSSNIDSTFWHLNLNGVGIWQQKKLVFLRQFDVIPLTQNSKLARTGLISDFAIKIDHLAQRHTNRVVDRTTTDKQTLYCVIFPLFIFYPFSLSTGHSLNTHGFRSCLTFAHYRHLVSAWQNTAWLTLGDYVFVINNFDCNLFFFILWYVCSSVAPLSLRIE